MATGYRSRVLVIDDEVALLEFIRRVLEADFEVSVAATAAEALARIDGETYDLVLCDRRLPGLDGVEVRRRLLASDQNGSTRFVLMSGDTFDPATFELARRGVRCLQKPFEIRQLCEALLEELAALRV